ncbi:MAG TPA: hypothetical protein VD735_06605 [Candidatus Saccharimonadales bacterium]|nr:hypothetical protein [Candidatus Saccharimonadales bacterium]
MQLFKLLLCIVAGYGAAHILNIHSIDDYGWYGVLVAALLAAGLYASTFGIELAEARKHFKIILSAVTFGVILKALLVGGVLALAFQDPLFLILGVAVAQIDPLSVAGLMRGNRLSAKAKTILASWASFDDPITVVLSLYVPLLVVHYTSLESAQGALSTTATDGLLGFAQGIGLNLLLAAGVFGVWWLVRRQAKLAAGGALVLTGALYVLLAASFSIAVFGFMMLGIALIGLFLRPPKVSAVIDMVIIWALRAAAVILGLLLVDGIAWWKGLALGVAAYFGQVLVGFLLTRSLPRQDRWHIAFAQQNGITAIILALLFEPAYPGTVAIVAPAIVVINGLHAVMNRLVDRHIPATL